jgi:hypothetical protein
MLRQIERIEVGEPGKRARLRGVRPRVLSHALIVAA